MRGEVSRIDAPESEVGDRLRHAGAPVAAIHGAMKNHRLRKEAQTELRESIAVWAGYYRAAGETDSVIMKRFYAMFGLDIMSAQVLGRTEAKQLEERLYASIR
jgi:hypothetical protein